MPLNIIVVRVRGLRLSVLIVATEDRNVQTVIYHVDWRHNLVLCCARAAWLIILHVVRCLTVSLRVSGCLLHARLCTLGPNHGWKVLRAHPSFYKVLDDYVLLDWLRHFGSWAEQHFVLRVLNDVSYWCVHWVREDRVLEPSRWRLNVTWVLDFITAGHLALSSGTLASRGRDYIIVLNGVLGWLVTSVLCDTGHRRLKPSISRLFKVSRRELQVATKIISGLVVILLR